MTEFDDIRAYNDDEVAQVIARLLDDPEFRRVVHWVFPDIDWSQFEQTMRSFRSIYDFQSTMIVNTVDWLLKKTCSSWNCTGFENIDKNNACTYISNHRDIVLDATIICVLLLKNGYNSAEIAIGDNLLIHPWIYDIVRLNKSFIVKRGVSIRQILEASKHLSAYIHYTIAQKKQSIWIAQREGRAKNSNDKTQESLLKMFSLGSETGFIESIRRLNITPLSISYEYDPCDYLKAKEFQLKRDNPEYKKQPQDDLENMQVGIMGYRGKVDYRISGDVNAEIKEIGANFDDKKGQIKQLARAIDKKIYANYTIFNVNKIAYDLLLNENRFANEYSDAERAEFEQYIAKQISKIDIKNKDLIFLRMKMLEMYANPLKNHLGKEIR